VPESLPVAFRRDHGCTLAEWRRWLPGAVGAHPLAWTGPESAEVAIGVGRLSLRWQVLPERRIALVRLPRLAVDYRFEALADGAQGAFMRYFDLYMHRGGG
jgi:hypothetical protein